MDRYFMTWVLQTDVWLVQTEVLRLPLLITATLLLFIFQLLKSTTFEFVWAKNDIQFFSKNEEKGKNIVPARRLVIERYVWLTEP